jgi:hypothetical protein
MTRGRALTGPQERMLTELQEPNSNPGNVWYFPQKDLRTLRVLARRGFAKEEDRDFGRHSKVGYSLTSRGREELKRRSGL